MSTEQRLPLPDKHLVRAARSLHHNREAKELAEARIERASDALVSYLGLCGLATARFGLFDVALVDGQVQVTKLPGQDAEQLALPEMNDTGPGVAGDPDAVAEQLAEIDTPATYDALAAPAPELYSPDDVEMLQLLRRFVSDLSRHYETRTTRPAKEAIVVSTPIDVYRFLAPEMAHLTQEQLRVLNLTIKGRVLSAPLIYQGTASSTQVRVAEVFRQAVIENAPHIIVAHNHPSGDPSPSQDDIAITRQIVQTGKLLDVVVLDHVIIGAHGFFSLSEHGTVPFDRR
jgi:DNA repair protein RadC